jgi:hypothetical protein
VYLQIQQQFHKREVAQPNAGTHLLPEAEATQERRL